MTVFARRYFLLFLIILSSTVCFSTPSRDFIFLAEIPTYAPFKTTLGQEDLLTKETRRLKKRNHWRKSPSPFEQKTFVIDRGASTPKKVTRGRFISYDHKQEKPRVDLNVETDAENIRSVADLFSKESFGTTDEESLQESAKALRIIILANRIKSLLSVKNHSLKVPHDYENENVLVLRGVWEPQWFHKTKKGRGFHYAAIPFKDVRDYLRACLRKKCLKEINALLAEEKKTSGLVPYHELREHLRIAEIRNHFVQNFIDLNPKARLYEATHDSDLLRLRIKPDKKTGGETTVETGLYSHYLKILRKKRSKHSRLPTVLSTGHRIAYEQERFENPNQFAWLYQVIEEDRYAKAVTSKVDFRAAYISEPNCLYLVPRRQTSIQQSYLLLPNGDHLKMGMYNKYDPCESMAIMVAMYSHSSRVTVHFDPRHPVLMKIPDRMLKSKTSKTSLDLSELGAYNFRRDVFRNVALSQAFNLSSYVSQSPFSYRDYAITLYRQFGFTGGTSINYNFFRSIIPTIFNYYDLKNHILRDDGSFQRPPTLNFTFTNGKSENDGDVAVNALVREINNIKRLNRASRQLTHLKPLMDDMYGPNIGQTIIGIARAMKVARTNHYTSFFSSSRTIGACRTTPKQAIEQSPKTEEASPPVKAKRKPPTARRNLFGATPPSVPPVKKEIKLEKRKAHRPSVDSFLLSSFRKGYSREVVTQLLAYFTPTDLAGRINKSQSVISKLKYPEKYGPNTPSAMLVWKLFHNKSIEDLRGLGFCRIKLKELAKDLGYTLNS